MSRDGALSLDDSLARRDVSSAWLVWSSAVEAALADAYRFAGGPVPDKGLVLGRGVFRTHFVRLGGPKVRKAREKPRSGLPAWEELLAVDVRGLLVWCCDVVCLVSFSALTVCVGILAEANVFRVVLRQIYGVVGWR